MVESDHRIISNNLGDGWLVAQDIVNEREHEAAHPLPFEVQMKLEQMYPDFNSMDEAAQTLFIRNYRTKRAIELSQPTTYIRKKKEPSGPVLSEEDKALLRKFGITQKTLTNLQIDEEPEDEGSFEFGDTYELNEEDMN